MKVPWERNYEDESIQKERRRRRKKEKARRKKRKRQRSKNFFGMDGS